MSPHGTMLVFLASMTALVAGLGAAAWANSPVAGAITASLVASVNAGLGWWAAQRWAEAGDEARSAQMWLRTEQGLHRPREGGEPRA